MRDAATYSVPDDQKMHFPSLAYNLDIHTHSLLFLDQLKSTRNHNATISQASYKTSWLAGPHRAGIFAETNLPVRSIFFYLGIKD